MSDTSISGSKRPIDEDAGDDCSSESNAKKIKLSEDNQDVKEISTGGTDDSSSTESISKTGHDGSDNIKDAEKEKTVSKKDYVASNDENEAVTSKDENLAVASKEENLGVTSKEENSAKASKEENLVEASNEENLAEASKEKSLAVDSKEEDLAVVSKEEELAVVSKEEDLAVDSKEEELAVVSKEKDLAVDSKDEELAVVSKEKDLAVDSKEEELAVVSKKEDVAAASKEEDLVIASKEESLTVASKEENLAIVIKEKNLAVDSKEEDLSVASSKKEDLAVVSKEEDLVVASKEENKAVASKEENKVVASIEDGDKVSDKSESKDSEDPADEPNKSKVDNAILKFANKNEDVCATGSEQNLDKDVVKESSEQDSAMDVDDVAETQVKVSERLEFGNKNEGSQESKQERSEQGNGDVAKLDSKDTDILKHPQNAKQDDDVKMRDVREEADKEQDKETVAGTYSVELESSKSEGSEKENAGGDKPDSPDCIVLSEDDLDMRKEKTEKTVAHRSKIFKKIRALQNQLRNEEATLVLLKKLRQSQMTPVQETPQQQAAPPKAPAHHSQQTQLIRQHPGPPPLVKGNQQVPAKMTHSINPHAHPRAQASISQARSHPQAGGLPPPLTPSRMGNGQANHQQHPHSSRSAVHQNVSRVSSGSNRSQQPQQQQQQQQQPQQQHQTPTPQKQVMQQPQHPPQDTQTPAQRQAAAKQALRKQLEKTLLQIPPPKPPPPEMNFIPSLACPDFVLLLGLEEVVNHMIDFQLIARGQKNPDERFVCTPFTCVQCGSDFTPVWKREKPGSKNVICEHCVTTNQKKALKQEHTNRLKSAFVKAFQQEQEIERMQASTTPVPPSPQPTNSSSSSSSSNNNNNNSGSSSSSSSQSLNLSISNQMLPGASAAAAAANAAAVAAVANFRPNAEQIRQHQNFIHQAQQAQLRGQPLGLQAFSHRAPFPYQLPFSKQQDLQRKYLLDMIPRGNMPWKQ